MSELTLKQSDEQDSGTFSPENYLGPLTAVMLNRLFPTPGGQTGANHYAGLVNLFHSLGHLLGTSLGGYVYKDSTDTDLQFSVQAFDLDFRGFFVSYAGAVNLGPMTAGATNHVWLDVSDAPTVTIGFGAAWPTVPHVKLDSIAAPATGAWKYQNRTRRAKSQAIMPWGSGIIPLKRAFMFASISPLKIATVPAGATVIYPLCNIGTAFDGTTPVVTVGDSGDNGRVLAASDISPKTIGVYPSVFTAYKFIEYASQTDLNIYITPDGSTVGAGTAVLMLVT